MRGRLQAWLAVLLLSLAWGVAQASSDVRLLLDISGSMKNNDPNNLRVPATRLLAQLVPAGSQAGVWVFGNQPGVLVPHQPVNDAWRQTAQQSAARISSSDQWTDIGAALEQASRAASQGELPKHLILLSDGMVDIAQDATANAAARRQVLEQTLPKLSAANFKVHTIALADQADKELLSRLAKETSGVYAQARSADDLARIFAQILQTAAPAEQLPLEGNTFLVDRTVKEFTLLVFRLPNSPALELYSPDKQTYNANNYGPHMRWFQDDKYDLVTVRRPQPGEWRIKAEVDPQNRVTIVSDFNLYVKPLPGSAFLGEKLELEFAFQEKGKNITIPAFHEIMENSARVLFPDGKLEIYPVGTEQLDAGSGLYRRPLDMLNQAGQHEVKVVVDGKTFRRLATMPITLHAPVEIKGRVAEQDGQAKVLVEATPDRPELLPESSTIKLELQGKDGSTQQADMVWMPEEKRWQAYLSPASQGTVIIKGQVEAKLEDGKSVSFNTPELQLDFSPAPDAPVLQQGDILQDVNAGMGLGGEGIQAETVDASGATIKVVGEPMEEAPALAEPAAEAAAETEVTPPEPAADEAAPAPAAEPEPAQEEESNLLLYASIVALNLLIVGGLIFLFWRYMRRRKVKDEVEDSAVGGSR